MKRKSIVWAIIGILVQASSAGEWPTFLGPNRNGVVEDAKWNPTFPKDGPKILWRARVGTGFSAISVSDGRALVAGNNEGEDTLYCFNAETGKEIWRLSYPCPILDRNHEGGPAAAVTIDGDRIYHLSRQGEIRCIEAESGSIVWEKNLPKEYEIPFPNYAFSATPLIEGTWVIVDVGTVFALNKTNGEVVWKSEPYMAGYGSPIAFTVKDQRILAVLNAPGLTLFDMKTGVTLSQREWHTYDNCNTTTPTLVGNDHIFISTGYNRGCSLFDVSDPTEIRTVYENGNMNNHFANSILVNGYLYGFDGQMHKGPVPLKCLNAETGENVWQTERVLNGALIVANETMIILTENGELVTAKASPDGYDEISRSQVLGRKAWTMPVLAEGKIYCRNARGDVVCVSVDK
ncbi:MAG: PQQ-binding-like beta-propeller repeat protein [Candidatus Omnitrophica bacterium]|nr:PQQ-binding-like beta-propeller repeat protein [Candidatus Omnitrophota bacterium]